MTRKYDETVAVVGLGYVGLPLAVLADEKGYKVIGLVRDKKKADLINRRAVPFKDTELQRELRKSQFYVTTDFGEVNKAQIVILCVPTPVDEHRLPDYGPVKSATKAIAPHLNKNALVILESTVNPGVCNEIMVPILEKYSGLRVGENLHLAHCPERINPGDKKWNVRNIPRVVGGFDAVSLRKAVKFYRSIIEGTITPMNSLMEAEACKVVENSFRNVNIAFVNELAMSFAKLNIDVVKVIQGASTKPFSFMPHFPGCGIGGHCIPVDPYYLIHYAKKKNGFEHKFLQLACQTNDDMPKYTVQMTEEVLKKTRGETLRGQHVTVLGIAYKADIDDSRESPAIEIINELKKRGAVVKSFDPYVKKLSTAQNLREAIDSASILLIATNHKQFLRLNPKNLYHRGVRLVIDGRNCLDKEAFVQAGLVYRGIGR